MTTFWIIAAALAFIAPLFVALPLLRSYVGPGFAGAGAEPKLAVYRDQLAELGEEWRAGRLGKDQYDQARGDLEIRLLEELPDAKPPLVSPAPRTYRLAAFVASIAVPLLAVSLYLALGNPGALRPQQTDSAHGLGQQQMDAMVARLAARLEQNPQDAKGWVMLARAQAVLGRFDAASAAYARSLEIFPDDAQLLADYADSLAMASGGRLSGEPEKLIERALSADPDNAKALALAGTIAFDNQNFALAIKHWERLRSSIPPDSEFAKSVKQSIDEATTLSLARGGVRKTSGAPAAPQTSASR
ncbi:MAG: c-type cytochrome biogenesis protein CcmI [Betaproteobacteria bacterium]|nr:MAG: c-type cytochrome biogenesis protein CcmI [Betaproteobacteria bacterium]